MVSSGIFVLAIFVSTRSTDHVWVTISFVVSDFCLVIGVLTCFSTCIDIGGDRVSTITGFMNFVGQSGAFLMSIIFGKLVDFTHNYELPQYILMILLFIGGVCWLGVDASKKIIGDSVVSIDPPALRPIPE